MKFKIFRIALSLVLMLSMATSVYAVESTSDIDSKLVAADESYVEASILANHGMQIAITDSYHLLDTSGNLTYTCVEFNYGAGKVGYGIVDLRDYTIPLYSLVLLPPFNKDKPIIYSGTFDFAEIQGNAAIATDVRTKQIADVKYFQNNVRDDVVPLNYSAREGKIASARNHVATISTETEVVVAGGKDTTLVYSAGNNSGSYSTDCGINAVAMYLRQLDNYFGGGYLMSTMTSESKLKISLAAYAKRTINQTTSLTTSQLATLCNGYTKEHGTSYTSISSKSYSWSTYKNTINSGYGRPCILRVAANTTAYWTGDHAVIGVGYTSGATALSGSLRVNSGWTSLGYVYIGTGIPTHIVC